MSENAEVLEDRLLARRAAAGSDVALTTLYDRYADPLFAFIVHRLHGSRSDAEDVFQETWLAALGSLQSYRGENRLIFWLHGIARHKIADRFPRHAGVGGRRPVSGDALSAQLDRLPLPEDEVARMETRALVVQAMALLPGEYRKVLLARYVNGQTVAEIAADLGRTYKAAESLLTRARARFRETLTLADEGGPID